MDGRARRRARRATSRRTRTPPTARCPAAKTSPIPDPLIWLAYVAAATTTHPARDRHPDPAAAQPGDPRQGDRDARPARRRAASSSASASAGCDEEFDALGVPFAARGARTDEYIDVLRRLWREPETAFDGEFTSFAPLKSYPKPARGERPDDPHRRAHAGRGAARRSDRRRLLPRRHRRRSRSRCSTTMRAAAKDAGRDADAIEITSGGGLDLDTVQALRGRSASSRFVDPAARLRPRRRCATQLGNVLRERDRACRLTRPRRARAARHRLPRLGGPADARVRRRLGHRRQRVGLGPTVVALREHRVDLVHRRHVLRPLPATQSRAQIESRERSQVHERSGDAVGAEEDAELGEEAVARRRTQKSSPRRSTVVFSGPTRCTNTGLSPGCAARISLQPARPRSSVSAPTLDPEPHRRAAVECELGPGDLHAR